MTTTGRHPLMARTLTRSKPAEFVSPKVAHLREVTGHNGPWTNSEYREAFGDPIAPSKDAEPDPPAEVVDAAEARDIAMAAFERADNDWRTAVLVERKAQDAGPVRITKDGQFLDNPEAPRKLRKARRKVTESREVRDLAEEALKRATVKWRGLHDTWRRQLIADEYHATKLNT